MEEKKYYTFGIEKNISARRVSRVLKKLEEGGKDESYLTSNGREYAVVGGYIENVIGKGLLVKSKNKKGIEKIVELFGLNL